MSSRETILAAILASQPTHSPLPDLKFIRALSENGTSLELVDQFIERVKGVGGEVQEVSGHAEILACVKSRNLFPKRVVSTLSELGGEIEYIAEPSIDPHSLENVELAILRAEFGVAENGALWLQGDLEVQRVLPFICQHLALIVDKSKILATMHDAYEVIGDIDYAYAAFIAGPSKTADIEQSLVIGAHGARSLTVFLLS